MKHILIAFTGGSILAGIISKSVLIGVVSGLAGFGLFVIIELLRPKDKTNKTSEHGDPAQAFKDIHAAFEKHLKLGTFEDAETDVACLMVDVNSEKMVSILALAAYGWKKMGDDPDSAFAMALAIEAKRSNGGPAAGEATMLWMEAINWGNSVGTQTAAWGCECVGRAAGRIK